MLAGRSRRERLLPRHASFLRDKSQVFDNSRNQRDAQEKKGDRSTCPLFLPASRRRGVPLTRKHSRSCSRSVSTPIRITLKQPPTKRPLLAWNSTPDGVNDAERYDSPAMRSAITSASVATQDFHSPTRPGVFVAEPRRDATTRKGACNPVATNVGQRYAVSLVRRRHGRRRRDVAGASASTIW